MQILRLLAAPALILLSATAALAGLTDGETLTFTGTTSDWYDVANWDLGRLPKAGDDVVLDSGRAVVIDPALAPAADPDPGVVRIGDLFISEGASLETLAGVHLTTRDEDVSDGGRLIHRSTRAVDDPLGGSLFTAPSLFGAGGSGGVYLNPTPKFKRDVVLQSSVSFGLGGPAAASNTIPGAYGPGHYATLTATTATLGGTLDVALYYGFTPTTGQSFQIITVDGERTGNFAGLAEGDLVTSFGNVGLYITYRGGDGNDVVLTAAALTKKD